MTGATGTPPTTPAQDTTKATDCPGQPGPAGSTSAPGLTSGSRTKPRHPSGRDGIEPDGQTARNPVKQRPATPSSLVQTPAGISRIAGGSPRA